MCSSAVLITIPPSCSTSRPSVTPRHARLTCRAVPYRAYLIRHPPFRLRLCRPHHPGASQPSHSFHSPLPRRRGSIRYQQLTDPRKPHGNSPASSLHHIAAHFLAAATACHACQVHTYIACEPTQRYIYIYVALPLSNTSNLTGPSPAAGNKPPPCPPGHRLVASTAPVPRVRFLGCGQVVAGNAGPLTTRTRTWWCRSPMRDRTLFRCEPTQREPISPLLLSVVSSRWHSVADACFVPARDNVPGITHPGHQVVRARRNIINTNYEHRVKAARFRHKCCVQNAPARPQERRSRVLYSL